MNERRFTRITADPRILRGTPCIRGMRISVAMVVRLVADGATTAEILEEYPDLEAEDVRESLRYAAVVVDEGIHPLPDATS